MTRTTIALFAVAALLAVAPVAHADDEAEVGICLRLVAQEKLPEGQRMVSNDYLTLMATKEAVYSFTLFKGNSYAIHTCAGANVADLDAHLYDQTGKLLEAKTEVDRTPEITIKPEKTGTYYLVLKLLGTTNQQPGAVGYVQLYE